MTEIERWWFRMHAANTDMPFPYNPDQTGQDFEALDYADAAASLEAFKQEIARPMWLGECGHEQLCIRHYCAGR